MTIKLTRTPVVSTLLTASLVLATGWACSEGNFGGVSGKASAKKGGNSDSDNPGGAATTIPVGDVKNATEVPGINDDGKDHGKIVGASSDDPSIASTDDDGNITGVAPGTTNVTVTFEDGTKQTIKVTVGDDSTDGGVGSTGSFKDVSTTDSNGSASAIFDNAEANIRKETFDYGAGSPLVDFLFVMDNSCSMGEIIDNTAAGFASLASGDVFPKKSLMAVMTTMPAEPGNDFAKVNHVATSGGGYPGLAKEPGFLDFVTKERIDAFKATTTAEYKAKWSKDGCADAWFAPGAKNAAGDACIVAHTQQSYFCVGVEAGLTAVFQLMTKNDGKRLFRKGTILNIIYVSDTHDPGADDAVFKAQKPTYDALKARIEKDNTLAGVKFHALAPETKCSTGEELNGAAYYPFVEASKGEKQDPCKTKDYTDFIKRMAISSTQAEKAVFKLSKPAAKVMSVFVDGTKTTDFSVDDEKDTITLPKVDPSKKVKVTIVYQYAE